MREALHIFMKDSRQQRVPIAVVLLWTALFVGVNVFALNLQSVPAPASPYGGVLLLARIAPFVLCLGLAYVLVNAVHADALFGDTQFWLTRPYSRRGLVGAKLLFVLAYVATPLAVAQAAIPLMVGLPLDTSLMTSWITSQLLMLIVVILPLLAVVSTTASIGWVVASVIPIVVAFSFFVTKSQELGPLGWVRHSAAAIVGPAVAVIVLWLQYGRRKTRVSQLVLLLGLLLAMGAASVVAWDGAFSVQQIATGRPGSGMSTSLMAPASVPFDVPRSSQQFQVGFDIQGVAADTMVSCEAVQLTVIGESGVAFKQPVRPVQGGRLTAASEGCTTFVVLPATMEALAAAPVALAGNVYVTVFEAERSTPLPLKQRGQVPDYGTCTARPGRYFGVDRRPPQDYITVSCDTAFRVPAVTFGIRAGRTGTDGLYRPSYSPWPATLSLSPVEQFWMTFPSAGQPTEAFTRRVAAHARLAIHAEDVDLKRFAVPQPCAGQPCR
jgi:hypothetical protein